MRDRHWTRTGILTLVLLLMGACIPGSKHEVIGRNCIGCQDGTGPNIGLTDTLYPQLKDIVKMLGGTPVELTTEASMQSYFSIPNPFKSAKSDTLTIVSDELELGGHPLVLWKVKEFEDSEAFDDHLRSSLALSFDARLHGLINREAVREKVEQLDGLLVGGGHDVNPLWYTDSKHPELGTLHNTRDVIELAFITEALRHEKPVMGICRGSQIFAVALGASLIQDLPSRYPDLADRHAKLLEREKSDGHPIQVDPSSTLRKILDLQPASCSEPWSSMNVNSYHHQAVDPALAGSLLEIGALDENSAPLSKQVIEGWVARRDHFAVGVQWHPERPRLRDGDTEEKAMFISGRDRLLTDPDRPHDRAVFQAFMTCARSSQDCHEQGYVHEERDPEQSCCSVAGEIHCQPGGSEDYVFFDGDTRSGVNKFGTYPDCYGDLDESGPESVFLFRPQGNGSAEMCVVVEQDVDLDIFALQGDCRDASSCRASANACLDFTFEKGETWYIVVDGYRGDSGSFDLSVQCR